MAVARVQPFSTCRPVPCIGLHSTIPARALTISHSYKSLENIDLSRVDNFKRHKKDCGSPEYQIARLSARVKQISTHMAENRKDYSARRGLEAVLNQRRSLLQYLHRQDRAAYERVCSELGIRSVVSADPRKNRRGGADEPAGAAAKAS